MTPAGLRSMPRGEDALMLPVAAGYCRYESMTDGTLDLADVVRMIAYINVRAYNDKLMSEMPRKR